MSWDEIRGRGDKILDDWSWRGSVHSDGYRDGRSVISQAGIAKAEGVNQGKQKEDGARGKVKRILDVTQMSIWQLTWGRP